MPPGSRPELSSVSEPAGEPDQPPQALMGPQIFYEPMQTGTVGTGFQGYDFLETGFDGTDCEGKSFVGVLFDWIVDFGTGTGFGWTLGVGTCSCESPCVGPDKVEMRKGCFENCFLGTGTEEGRIVGTTFDGFENGLVGIFVAGVEAGVVGPGGGLVRAW